MERMYDLKKHKNGKWYAIYNVNPLCFLIFKKYKKYTEYVWESKNNFVA